MMAPFDAASVEDRTEFVRAAIDLLRVVMQPTGDRERRIAGRARALDAIVGKIWALDAEVEQ